MIYINEDEYLESLEFSKPKYIKQTIKRTVVKQENKEIVAKLLLEVNPIYRYSKDGELVDKYLNPKQMANKLRWREHSLLKAANQEKLYNGFILSKRNYTKEQFIERFKTPKKTKIEKLPKPKKEKVIRPKKEKVIKPKKEKKKLICYIYQYNVDGELIARYDNGRDLVNRTNYKRNTIKNYSEQERIYDGYLFSRKEYTQEQAKKIYSDKLNSQQMSYVYKDGLLFAVCTSLKEVKKITNTELSFKKISYHKGILRPINGYIISKNPL